MSVTNCYIIYHEGAIRLGGNMIIRDWTKDLFTIPNLLSLFRLLLIPVYVIIYLQADSKADHVGAYRQAALCGTVSVEA